VVENRPRVSLIELDPEKVEDRENALDGLKALDRLVILDTVILAVNEKRTELIESLADSLST
jgi:hypothetical protein